MVLFSRLFRFFHSNLSKTLLITHETLMWWEMRSMNVNLNLHQMEYQPTNPIKRDKQIIATGIIPDI